MGLDNPIVKNESSISNSTSGMRAFAFDWQYIYGVTTNPLVLRKYDPVTFVQSGSDIPIFTTATSTIPTDLIIVGSTAYISTNTARMGVVDLVGGSSFDVTFQAYQTSSTQKSQQFVFNESLGVGIMTAQITNNATTVINGIPGAYMFTPSIGVGKYATCVTVRTNSDGSHSSSWLFGTDNGTVVEAGLSGTIIKTITLPNTKALGGTNELCVVGVSYSYPNALITTSQGIAFFYNWETSTLLKMFPTLSGDKTITSFRGSVLSHSASGYTAMGHYSQFQSNSYDIVRFNGMNLSFINKFRKSTTRIDYTYLNPYVPGAIFMDSPGSTFDAIVKFDFNKLSQTYEETEYHDPQGVRSSARIIRINDEGIGQSAIELDTYIASNVTSTLPCRKDSDYIEIAISSDTQKWDIREFSK